MSNLIFIIRHSKFVITLTAIILINIAASFFQFRFDLTEDKRYSITDASKNLLNNVEEEIFVRVYLEGDDFPAGFKRLQKAVLTTLEQFKDHAGTKINYQFINPSAEADNKKREAFYATLIEKGLEPTNLIDNQNGRRSENIIFPWAIVSYEGKELPVLLLKGRQGLGAEEKLNQSIENVEYELSTAFRKLTNKERKSIGLLTEFTKLPPVRFAGLITSLQEFYDVFILDAKKSSNFEGLDALILPKPDLPIDDSTKYKIDQFVVNGGKALFFVDGLKVEEIGQEGSYAQPYKNNLEDLFFTYGLRLNNNIVKDGVSCAMIPLNVGTTGDKPNIQLTPYRYFPLINNFGKSLITKNLDLIYLRFVSTIDTVRADGITKTPLLSTTAYTKILNAPALVTYNEARKETEQAEYKAGVQHVAYLMEGQFQSLYKNRLFANDARFASFKDKNKKSKIILVADGDLIVNELAPKTGQPLPLGFDKYSQHTFGNQDFVMQSLDFLLDDDGAILSRAKELKLRLLDKVRVREEHLFWQVLNLTLPILLIVVMGFLWHFNRKRKYS